MTEAVKQDELVGYSCVFCGKKLAFREGTILVQSVYDGTRESGVVAKAPGRDKTGQLKIIAWHDTCNLPEGIRTAFALNREISPPRAIDTPEHLMGRLTIKGPIPSPNLESDESWIDNRFAVPILYALILVTMVLLDPYLKMIAHAIGFGR